MSAPIDAEAPSKRVVRLPPTSSAACTRRLISWLAYPRPTDVSKREQLTLALVDWYWRSARADKSVVRAKPDLLREHHPRDYALALNRMGRRLNAGREALFIWRLTRSSRLSQSIIVHLPDGEHVSSIRSLSMRLAYRRSGIRDSTTIQETSDNIRKRIFGLYRPVLHVVDVLDSWVFPAVARRAKCDPSDLEVAVFRALENPWWVSEALRRAEMQRVEINHLAGLSRSKTYRFVLPDDVQNLNPVWDV